MTNVRAINEIHHQLYLYRVKCDMALSERDDGVITQEEYEQAIKRQGDLNAEALNQLIQTAQREARQGLCPHNCANCFTLNKLNSNKGGKK